MAYLIATTAVFWLVFLIWSRDDLYNFCLKSLFLGMAFWSTFNLMELSGYIIKIGG